MGRQFGTSKTLFDLLGWEGSLGKGWGHFPALQRCPYFIGVVSMLYFPTAFFALSQGPLPHLADELLLLIQPLSVLTFHLDLLFEHHHLSVDVRPLSRRMESPPSPTPRFAQGAAQRRGGTPRLRARAGGEPAAPLRDAMPAPPPRRCEAYPGAPGWAGVGMAGSAM